MTWWEKLISDELFVIAGPCGAEDRDQVLQTAEHLVSMGSVQLMRAGLWKPRTRPGSFEGEGIIGGQWLLEAKEQTGLGIVTEVANADHVAYCLENNFDAIWIGARTVVNPFSVQEIAEDVAPSAVAFVGADLPRVRPRFEVEEGAPVAQGQVLFRDRKNPEVVFVSPIAGRLLDRLEGAGILAVTIRGALAVGS